MAQRLETQLLDDLDGTTAHETVRFTVDGAVYEIDLSKANAKELRGALAPYLAAGRTRRRAATKTSPRRAAVKQARASANIDAATVRAWALKAGLEVGVRGRIPAVVIDQYLAAR